MRIANVFVLFSLLSFGLLAQTEDDSLKKRDLNQVDIYGKQNKYFKAVSLYDAYDFDTTENINGFRAVNIYRDEISDEVWKTENVKYYIVETQCIASPPEMHCVSTVTPLAPWRLRG